MTRARSLSAVRRAALLASALLLPLALAGPAEAWPFGHKGDAKPAAAKTSPDREQPPKKATPAERAAAERLPPLARAAFWTQVTDADPTDTDAGVRLASALRALGRDEEAAQAAARVLVLDPKNYAALMESARAIVAQGQGFYALPPLRQAQAQNPRDWRPVSLEGVALEQTKRLDDARLAYARALQLAPGEPAVLSNLAMSYALNGDPGRAEGLLRQAAASPRATAQERQNLALVLGLQGKYAEAERLIRQDLPPELADNNLDYLKSLRSAPGYGAGLRGGGAQPGTR